MLQEDLETQAKDTGRESARERVRRDLEAAQRKARHLADAIARGGEMDALLAGLREEIGRIDGLRADLERLDHAAPVAIKPQRILATARKRLAALSKLLQRGGVEARPVVAAVLGTERLVATPIEVNGSKRWQLAGQISAGYLMSHVVREASLSYESIARLEIATSRRSEGSRSAPLYCRSGHRSKPSRSRAHPSKPRSNAHHAFDPWGTRFAPQGAPRSSPLGRAAFRFIRRARVAIRPP